MLREVHKPLQIYNLLSHHTHTLSDRHNKLTLSRRPRALTSYTSRCTWPCPRDGHTAWRHPQTYRKYTYGCRHTHKPTRTYYTQALASTEMLRSAAGQADTNSSPRYSASSTRRATEALAHLPGDHRHTPRRREHRVTKCSAVYTYAGTQAQSMHMSGP